jgi:hypothetical protein
MHLHIVVDFNLWEQSNILRHQTESNVTTAITGGAFDTLPILDTGQDHIDQFTKEVVHILAIKLSLDSDGITTRRNTPSSNVSLGLESLNAHVGDRLDSDTSDVQPRRVPLKGSVFHVAVDGDALKFGDVVELDGLAEQAQDVTTTGSTENTVLVVGRAVVPLTETGCLRGWLKAWWCVDVAQGHDVGGDG